AREDHVWPGANHITRQFRIMLGPFLAGVSLYDEVASFDIPEPTKFLEKHPIPPEAAGLRNLRYRERRGNDGNAMDFRGLLCPCMSQSGRDQQTGYELPPPHIRSPVSAERIMEREQFTTR